ncbi:MAG: hypothetical protein H0U10_01840 [Chloroflexia bacterium]|nr:hypothetical protein [Chloroflexia bacterium]
MTSNDDVALILVRFGGLLRLSGENPFRTRAYLTAADAVRNQNEPVVDLAAAGRLRQVAGIGDGIAAAIGEICATGTFAAFEKLVSALPPSLLDLMALPGIGPKTVLRLHREFGVTDLVAIESALARGDFRDAKGLGPRFEAEIDAGHAAIRARSGQIPIGRALPAARSFAAALRQVCSLRVEIAGGVRRFAEAVERLSVLVETTDPASSAAAVTALPYVAQVLERTSNQLQVQLQSGEEADVRLAAPDEFGLALLRATGPASHLEQLGPLPDSAPDETAIYAALGLPWIPPELRSISIDSRHLSHIPTLVVHRDIKGDLHSTPPGATARPRSPRWRRRPLPAGTPTWRSPTIAEALASPTVWTPIGCALSGRRSTPARPASPSSPVSARTRRRSPRGSFWSSPIPTSTSSPTRAAVCSNVDLAATSTGLASSLLRQNAGSPWRSTPTRHGSTSTPSWLGRCLPPAVCSASTATPTTSTPSPSSSTGSPSPAKPGRRPIGSSTPGPWIA